MKHGKKLLSVLLALVMVLALLPSAAFAAEGEKHITILGTSDMHGNIWGFSYEDNAETANNGMARLYTYIQQVRAENPNTILIDAGDDIQGTIMTDDLYNKTPEESHPVIAAMNYMGYDAMTLGNHEFNWGIPTMQTILSQAEFPVLAANVTDEKGELVTGAGWTIVERDGLRVAVFGIMGISSDDYAPMSGMVLEDPIEAARRVMEELQAKEDYDYVVCLSHSGTEDGEGEDYELAKAVDGIDVIISGHTHTTLEQPIEVNDTLIVSCGEYTKNLGVLTIGKDGGSGATVQLDYQLIPVTEEVPEDPAIAELTEQFKTLVEEDYLADYGYTFDQVLAQSPFDFTPISQFGLEQEEDGLGNLIADSYVYAVEQAEGADYVPVDFAVVASGVIRGSFAQGPITVSDVFNVSSLGSGADGTPGYPLISVWITGKELKDAFEVDASVTPLMSPAQLYGAGMTWTYNTSRMIFNKVTDCAQVLPDGSQVPLEDDRLYRVVTGLYSGQMLSSVEAKSFGLLAITPKTADGTEVTDFEAQIIHNADGTEVKEWYALASYLENLETVPTEYAQPQGRKVVYSSLNPVELLKHPNWITLVVLAVVLVVLAVLVFVVYRIATRGRRRRRGGSGRQRYRPYRGR